MQPLLAIEGNAGQALLPRQLQVLMGALCRAGAGQTKQKRMIQTMVTKMQFHTHTFQTEIGGRTLTVETGKMAGLANGSCLIRYGETVVLVTATASESRATASTSSP